jgi:hypothetical protein
VFSSWGGFRYSIARTARERPIFSDQVFETEYEARRSAWDALTPMTAA